MDRLKTIHGQEHAPLVATYKTDEKHEEKHA
jgi:hypothetical protein